MWQELYHEDKDVWVLFGDKLGVKLWMRGDKLAAQAFYYKDCKGRQICSWGNTLVVPGGEILVGHRFTQSEELWALYKEGLTTGVPVRRVIDKGRWYLGGHNTAARLDWPISTPPPREESVLWWDSTESGRDTGYFPSTTNLIKEGTYE